MPDIATLATWEGIILVSGLFGVIFWKLMTGTISLEYLLYGEARVRDGGGSSSFFSPGRTQMLTFTVFFSIYFLLQVIQDPTKFPDVPDGMLVILGGSHAIYLTGKAQALYLGRMRDWATFLNRGGRQ